MNAGKGNYGEGKKVKRIRKISKGDEVGKMTENERRGNRENKRKLGEGK